MEDVLTAAELSQLWSDQRDRIISDFIAEVRRKNLSPPGLTRPLLADEIPTFLDCVAVELSRSSGGAATL